jgi:hypothetical protein
LEEERSLPTPKALFQQIIFSFYCLLYPSPIIFLKTLLGFIPYSAILMPGTLVSKKLKSLGKLFIKPRTTNIFVVYQNSIRQKCRKVCLLTDTLGSPEYSPGKPKRLAMSLRPSDTICSGKFQRQVDGLNTDVHLLALRGRHCLKTNITAGTQSLTDKVTANRIFGQVGEA